METTKAVLYTDENGRANFREETIPLLDASPNILLSARLPAAGLRLRWSPVGFESGFHCTTTPQWVFVLQGAMEIGLQDGSKRVFESGEFFYADDVLPHGAVFDAGKHGHSSRQVGAEPLMTLFVPD